MAPGNPPTETPAPTAAQQPAVEPQPSVVPIAKVRPIVPSDTWHQIVALARYLVKGEVHTYAFSVAANVILSLFPFIVLMLTLSRSVFHSKAMEAVVGDLFRSLLPTAQDFVLRNAHPHKGAQVFSILMLLVSSTGVFLPLEVALNDVWGVRTNRNYLHNQIVSLGLALAVGALAMASVAFSAAQKSVMTWVFMQHTDNIVFTFISDGFLNICALIASILLFFLIYWILPNRTIPARAVLPTAIVIGVLWEIAKYLYVLALPKLDFQAVYGPFYISAGLMMWAFLSGLLLLAGAHFSATRFALAAACEEEAELQSDAESDAHAAIA